MKNLFRKYFWIWLLLLAAFNAVVFLIPSDVAEGYMKFGGAFWSAYAFITIAFVGQLIISGLAFRAENAKKFFYRIPLIAVSWASLIATLILGTLCMIIPNLPNWAGIILCGIVLLVYAIALLSSTTAEGLVEGTDRRVENSTMFIKMMIRKSSNLVVQTDSEQTKADCRRIYEAFRYSDPVSCEETLTIENQIACELDAFREAISLDSTKEISVSAEAIIKMIGERNAICKSSKQ